MKLKTITFKKKKSARPEDVQYLKDNYTIAKKDLFDLCYVPYKFSITTILMKLKTVSLVLSISYRVTGNKNDLVLSQRCHEVIKKINIMPEHYTTIVQDLRMESLSA